MKIESQELIYDSILDNIVGGSISKRTVFELIIGAAYLIKTKNSQIMQMQAEIENSPVIKQSDGSFDLKPNWRAMTNVNGVGLWGIYRLDAEVNKDLIPIQ